MFVYFFLQKNLTSWARFLTMCSFRLPSIKMKTTKWRKSLLGYFGKDINTEVAFWEICTASTSCTATMHSTGDYSFSSFLLLNFDYSFSFTTPQPWWMFFFLHLSVAISLSSPCLFQHLHPSPSNPSRFSRAPSSPLPKQAKRAASSEQRATNQAERDSPKQEPAIHWPTNYAIQSKSRTLNQKQPRLLPPNPIPCGGGSARWFCPISFHPGEQETTRPVKRASCLSTSLGLGWVWRTRLSSWLVGRLLAGKIL